jgi:(+)-pinoresinol hydroxylase
MFGNGSGLPGTAALSLKYKGRVPAVLEQRTDLAPAFIRTVVRHGLFGMPITRKTEVNDAELEDIVAYLARNRKR